MTESKGTMNDDGNSNVVVEAVKQFFVGCYYFILICGMIAFFAAIFSPFFDVN